MTSEQKQRLKDQSYEKAAHEVGRKEFVTDLQLMASFEASGDIHKADSLYVKMRCLDLL